MRIWQSYILAALLLGAVFCRAEPTADGILTIPEYRAELERLGADAQKLNNSRTVPGSLQHLPPSWRVHTEKQDFEISSQGLRRDIRRYEGQKNVANASAIRARLESLRREIDGFELAPPDIFAQRSALNGILARREFNDVHGPTRMDRLKRWMFEKILRALRTLFRSSAIPTVGNYFVYALIGAAGLSLLYLVYRSIFRNREFEEVVPRDLPVSAKEWTIWLAEARAAAATGDWRDAIHLAYWAGISFLEREGFWKPDRARTPREYLRLISPQNQQRETLRALTRIFELAWYAKRQTTEQTFIQTLQELEKLGCR
jgi:hypothetical protein